MIAVISLVRAGADLEKIRLAIAGEVKSTAGVLEEPAAETLVTGIRTDHTLVRVRFWVSEFIAGDPVASKVLEKVRTAERPARCAIGDLPEMADKQAK